MKRSSLYLTFILLSVGLVIYFRESPDSLLVIYHEGQPWLLEAEHGKFTEENRDLLLRDKGVASSMVDTDQPTRLLTEKPEIKPEEKYAYTQEPVKISSPSGEINTIGMIANFREKHNTLLSNVKGTHDPVL